MNVEMRKLQQAYFEEADELLASMEQRLLEIDLARPDGESLSAVLRCAHSIKGGAAAFGFADVIEVSHMLESLLDQIRRGEKSLRGDMIEAFLGAGDVLGRLLARHRGTRGAGPADAAPICPRLEAFVAETELPARPGAAPATGGERSPGRRAADRTGGATADAGSIRVNLEKIDHLVDLVGELANAHAMLAQSASKLERTAAEALLGNLGRFERNLRDLQEAVVLIRTMPVGFVFSRFPRLVRDLAARFGKQVELKMVGEATELDKGLIDHIIDPLTHLVRNSLDHGIELPEVRVAAGKPACGTVTLSAFRRGGSVVVEVADDGAGLSRERILGKARELGLPVGDAPSDQELWQLIFEAGFSTAAVVSEVSGRGVGMDVVRRNVEALGGSVEIDSGPGAGTRTSIRLPLAPVILGGMVREAIALGGNSKVVPLPGVGQRSNANSSSHGERASRV